LTSANERQYQIPFCQLLAAEGETVFYISPHGPLEKGKDVISKLPTSYSTYQMKGGDIGLSEWRAIYGEIVNLVELPIEHPSVGLVAKHQPFLVTNGTISDPVLEQIRSANTGWKARGVKNQLKVISKGELLARFLKVHGSYLPKEPADFRLFLELVLRVGNEPLDKEKFSTFLRTVLPFEDASVSPLNSKRAIASVVLLSAYVLQSSDNQGNYWALFEGWTVVAAHILALVEKLNLIPEFWKESFDLCSRASDGALEELWRECKSRQHLIEGDGLTDGHTYATRITLLLGLLSCFSLQRQLRNRHKDETDREVANFLVSNLRHGVLWGESAIPYLVLTALNLEQFCEMRLAEGQIARLALEVANLNGITNESTKGLPDVYVGPERAIRIRIGLEDSTEDFVGHSYTLEAMLHFLARRWLRVTLSLVWFGFTRLSLLELRPANKWEWYVWKAESGELRSRFVDEPQSWQNLLMEAERLNAAEFPATLLKDPAFLLKFLLVYPHRFQSPLVLALERALL
jgi:hypothetical protein